MAGITQLSDWDEGPSFIVPGTDPAAILADAAGELDDDMEILTPLDEVRVEWWRTNPCHPNNCDEGPHRTHYWRTGGRTRGGFQAAEIRIGFKEDS